MKKLLQIAHHNQSVGQRIFRVEQTDVGMVVAKMKIMTQNPVVEQQLNVMFFFLKAAVSVGLMAFNVVVGTRFLFNQQPEVGCYQVDTPLQAQLFTHERRFENGF